MTMRSSDCIPSHNPRSCQVERVIRQLIEGIAEAAGWRPTNLIIQDALHTLNQ